MLQKNEPKSVLDFTKAVEITTVFFYLGAYTMKYYYDNTGLWRKDNSEEYFYSRKNLDWIKCETVFVYGNLEYFGEITEKEALKKIENYIAAGKIENETLPIRYFLDNRDDVWAMDIKGNKFVFSYKTKKLEPTDYLDLMWSGCSEEYAKKRIAEIAGNK